MRPGADWRVGAVILHYRFFPDVLETLDAITAQTHALERVVVVDNDSADGSVEKLMASRPDLEVVTAPRNGGYAAGMNVGLQALAGSDLDGVLLVTHECALHPDAVSHLVDHLAADPQVGAAGPLLVWRDRPETVYSAGVRLDPKTWHHFHDGVGDQVATWAGTGPRRVDSVDGAAMLLRTAAVDSVGPLDEDYFMYYEEMDYLARLRRVGWAISCVPAAVGPQQPGHPSQAMWVRNRLRYLTRNAPRQAVARELLDQTVQTGKDLIRNRRGAARARVTGVAALLRRRPATDLRDSG